MPEMQRNCSPSIQHEAEFGSRRELGKDLLLGWVRSGEGGEALGHPGEDLGRPGAEIGRVETGDQVDEDFGAGLTRAAPLPCPAG